MRGAWARNPGAGAFASSGRAVVEYAPVAAVTEVHCSLYCTKQAKPPFSRFLMVVEVIVLKSITKMAPEVGLGPQVLDFTNEIGGVFAEVKATRLLLGHY